MTMMEVHPKEQALEVTVADDASNAAVAAKMKHDHRDYDFVSQVPAVALLSAVASAGTTRYALAL